MLHMPTVSESYTNYIVVFDRHIEDGKIIKLIWNQKLYQISVPFLQLKLNYPKQYSIDQNPNDDDPF